MLVTAWSEEGEYHFVTKWTPISSGNPQIDTIAGIAIDSAGNVYVTTNCPNNLIQKFSSKGSFITSWGSTGSGNGQFNAPGPGIAVGQTGYVYVVDLWRIQKFSSNGTFITKWGSQGLS